MAKISLKGQVQKQEDEIRIATLEQYIKLNLKILTNAVKHIQNWETLRNWEPGGLFDSVVTAQQRAEMLRGYFTEYSKLKNKKYK